MVKEEKKRLQKLLDLLLLLSEQVEKAHSDTHKESKNLQSFTPNTEPSLRHTILEIKTRFAELEHTKLRELSHHLDSPLSERHILNIIIPIERELKKNITDLDLHISTLDKADSITSVNQPIPCIFVLDNIRSAFNVGSIIRNFDGLGGELIYFTGYTTTPEHEQVQKTAMGAHEKLRYRTFPHLTPALKELRSLGYRLIAVETAQPAKSIYENFEQIPSAFIFGNERFGLDAETIQMCDEVRCIPLHGFKNSLNVAVASALIGFEWRRQYKVL